MRKGLVIILIMLCSCFKGISQAWNRSDSLWNKYFTEERYDSALYYAGEASAIMRGTAGENNSQFALLLEKLAITYYALGEYKKAEYLILQEIGLWESLKKTDQLEYINCLETATLICRKEGDYGEALKQIDKADRTAKDIYNPEGPVYAEIFYYYAGLYHDMGCSDNDMVYLKLEEKYLNLAENVYEKYGERKTNELIINKSDLAVWNNNMGNSPAAEALLMEVKNLCEKKFGAGSTAYAAAMNNLAVIYYYRSDYKHSEQLLVDAIDIYKKSPEAGSIRTAACLNNLGALYQDIGNYGLASDLINEARHLYEKNLQQENPAYAVLLNNLASVSIAEEYYAAAENKNRQRLVDAGKMLATADSVFLLNCRKPHPFSKAIMTNIAIWDYVTGNRKKAADIWNDMMFDSNISNKLIAMMDKMSISERPANSGIMKNGPDPVLIPITVKLVAELTENYMQFASSGESDAIVNGLLKLMMGKANNIKKAVGPYHQAYATMLKSLIGIYNSFDDEKTAEELTIEYINVINHKTLLDFTYLSESEKEMYYQTRLPDQDYFTSFSLSRMKANPLITRNTYNNVLLNKGLMLKSSTAMRVAILNSGNPELLKKYDEWTSLQKQISVLYATPLEMRTQDLTVLEKQANDLEKSLVESSQDFSDYRKGFQITWADVRKNLQPDEAAIEFTDFRKREMDGGNAVIYCALVVRSNSEYPEMIKLFDESQLRAIISQPGVNAFSGVNNIYGAAGSQNDKLYNLVWKPVEPYLNGIKKVYISPSGLLNKISFPAISKDKDVYLCDEYQIEIKESTGNVVNQAIFSQESKPTALVFGGIQYGSENSNNDVWPYLKGTKDEGDTVRNILEKGKIEVSYLSGSIATETSFKQDAPKYNILHLATHGFFFPDPNEIRFEEKKQEVEFGRITFRGSSSAYGVNSFVNNDNPLMRSGLVLAGANDVWDKPEKEEADDGVLTAQEVTQIDMRKNDLVVLSACETGLGDIKGIEGVYGLQRALKMAGVKFIIMSLWQIPDRETVEFMSRFYNYLVLVKDIKSAFYKTQMDMRAKYDPYYWGAFVLLE
jgi:CHAT domain-containing protein/soluble cytochrome b562